MNEPEEEKTLSLFALVGLMLLCPVFFCHDNLAYATSLIPTCFSLLSEDDIPVNLFISYIHVVLSIL